MYSTTERRLWHRRHWLMIDATIPEGGVPPAPQDSGSSGRFFPILLARVFWHRRHQELLPAPVTRNHIACHRHGRGPYPKKSLFATANLAHVSAQANTSCTWQGCLDFALETQDLEGKLGGTTVPEGR